MEAGPEHPGTGLWEVVVEPVELAQPPRSQVVVGMGALEQVGQSPVDAAATVAVAASGAAPAAAAENEVATTSDIWGSPIPGWWAAG